MSTALAPLELINPNSQNVESLASYVRRLAATHGVGPFQLGKLIAERWAITSSHSRGFELCYPLCCSYSPSTAHAVEILESLTGQSNLGKGTLLALSECLTPNFSGCLSEIRRWCPACYADQDWIAAEPLSWGMSLITWCPIHGTDLQSRCAECGTQQPHFRTADRYQLCIACNQPLSTMQRQDKGLRTPWRTWCQQQMLDMMKHTTDEDFRPFPTNPFHQAAKELAGWPRKSGKISKFVGNSLKKTLLNDTKPRLSTVFRLAALLSCSPYDLLQRPVECSSPLLFTSPAPIEPPARKPRIAPEVVAEYQQELERLLQTDESTPLPPLNRVCQPFGVTSAQLFASSHALYLRYAAERRRRNGILGQRLRNRAATMVLDVQLHAIEHGAPMKRKQSIAKIVAITKLPKHIVEAAWVSTLAITRRRQAEPNQHRTPSPG